MRILVLSHEYPPIGGGGGRVAQDICHGLAAKGHQILILTAHQGDLPFEEEQDGIQIRRIKSWRRLPFRADMKAMIGYVWKSFWTGLKIIREWKPDVIHDHFAVPAGASAWALSLFTGVPYVLTAHLGDIPGGSPVKTGKWFKWVFPFTHTIWRRAARVVAVSEYSRNLASTHYPVDIEVIPNGVDLDEINPGQITLNDPPVVIFAGRFMPEKNPLQIVRTMANLKDLSWKCVLIGDGPLREDMEREISQNNLQDRFLLPGWVTPEEVLDWYTRGDVLFMPSLSEGLPVAGVQALSMGLALVLSSAGGNVELVEQSVNGYLVDKEDISGYERSFRTLLGNPETLLNARRASRQLAKKFDINVVVESYERVFVEVQQK